MTRSSYSVTRRELLARGVSVIFLHRESSKRPFVDTTVYDALHHPESRLGPLSDSRVVGVRLTSEEVRALRDRSEALASGRLVEVPFRTVQDYMWLLHEGALAVNSAGETAIVMLAAAVSDFFLPWDHMPEHKIQSNAGAAAGLSLQLLGVPKLLGAFTLPSGHRATSDAEGDDGDGDDDAAPAAAASDTEAPAEEAAVAAGSSRVSIPDAPWCPRALVVSFKLETDEDMLEPKARAAISRYAVDAVVANLLHDRYARVTIFSADHREPLVLATTDGSRLEAGIVDCVLDLMDTTRDARLRR